MSTSSPTSTHVLSRFAPATAANRYRALQQLFRWLVDEGEITRSPMERMRPPLVPEQPVPVLSEEQIRAFLKTLDGKGYADRRDTAILPRLRGHGGGSQTSSETGRARKTAAPSP